MLYVREYDKIEVIAVLDVVHDAKAAPLNAALASEVVQLNADQRVAVLSSYI